MHQSGKSYIHDMNGAAKTMPIIFTCFALCGMGLMGVPGLAGFISKWNIAEAAVDSENPLAYVGIIALLISALLTGIYIMSIVIRAFFPNTEMQKDVICEAKDPSWKMCIPVMICAVGTLILGLFSQPLVQFFVEIAQGRF